MTPRPAHPLPSGPQAHGPLEPSGRGGRELILVIDDQSDLIRFCERSLGADYDFRYLTNGPAALPLLAGGGVGAVIVDRDFSRGDCTLLVGPPGDARNEGVHILRRLRREFPQVPMLMVTGVREQGPALEVAELGCDFLAWQDITEDPGIMRARLQRALDQCGVNRDAVVARFRELGIVAESERTIQALVDLYRCSGDHAPLLLSGETGTGKDTLALAAHVLGGDPGRPFVSVNVAALNANLIESELFGHARGAFTGADRAQVGKLRHAHGGTLFLNEIGELSLSAQAKLLSAIETGEVVPVGEVASHPASFRLISATSRDMAGMVSEGTVRRDFYHRLAWHHLTIPPLRERREDIPALVHAFLHGSAREGADGISGISREAVHYLAELPWPGNVRELKATLQAARAVASYFITLTDLRDVVRRHESAPPPAAPGAAASAVAGPAEPAPRRDTWSEDEAVFSGLTYRQVMERYFAFLYRQCGGRLPELARLAGIAKATAYEWKEKYGRRT